ncbi:ATP phosphoribosyltransferase [Candidatus Margulisiibacteriota bacterium]
MIKIGIPKGSLEGKTKELFKKAGYVIKGTERSYFPNVDDNEIEVMLVRAQEISRYVEQGVLDVGITGSDWVKENDSDVATIAELVYAKAGRKKVKWVLAVPSDSKINSVKDLEGKRIATELVKASEAYLKKNNVKASVEFSWGATEAKPPELADAIIEITETGSSLKANKLKIIDTIMESVTVVVANKASLKDAWKKEKIDNVTLLLKGALMAEEMVGLKMNILKNKLDGLLKILPALQKPTISPLSDDKWVDVDTIIEEKVVREIIPKLKKAGASGIVEYPLNKVIPD